MLTIDDTINYIRRKWLEWYKIYMEYDKKFPINDVNTKCASIHADVLCCTLDEILEFDLEKDKAQCFSYGCQYWDWKNSSTFCSKHISDTSSCRVEPHHYLDFTPFPEFEENIK